MIETWWQKEKRNQRKKNLGFQNKLAENGSEGTKVEGFGFFQMDFMK